MNNGDDEHQKTLERARKIDLGPAPWCPRCGSPAQGALALPSAPGFVNHKKKLGVCIGCGIVAHPEVSHAGEMLPFLFHVSDLRPGIPESVLDVQRQVRAKLRSAS